MVGNLTKKNRKCQMPGGQPGGRGMGTLGFDSYIKFYFTHITELAFIDFTFLFHEYLVYQAWILKCLPSFSFVFHEPYEPDKM